MAAGDYLTVAPEHLEESVKRVLVGALPGQGIDHQIKFKNDAGAMTRDLNRKKTRDI